MKNDREFWHFSLGPVRLGSAAYNEINLGRSYRIVIGRLIFLVGAFPK